MGKRHLLLVLALLIVGTRSVHADSYLALGGHMYGTTPDLHPSPGFQAALDSLSGYPLDAYIAGGDCTFSGAAAEWDTLQSLVSAHWSFDFVPVLGNHDATDLGQWYQRWGDDTYRTDYDSTRVLILWSGQYPNGNMDQEHLDFIVSELAQAATDPSVTDVLVVQHHLAWVKNHPRYEIVRQMGNGWYDEFSGRGYDVNAFFDEIWPSMASLAQAKPVTFYCGDAGYSALRPGIFYDVLDGVTLLASGYDVHGDEDSDAVILYRAVGGQVQLQLFSPWGWPLGQVQDYDLAYWEARLAGPADPAPAVPPAPAYPDEASVGATTFGMGDHIDPRYGTYEADTGYTVSVSPFVMAVDETTVREYLDFLNDAGNLYEGVSCVDLADAQCQIQEVAAGVFEAKAPELLDQPVVEVSWYGAVAYCNWRSGRDGLSPAYAGVTLDPAGEGWRLPTEAEFEAALRGPYGTTAEEPTYRRFWWGDDSEDHVHDFANYHGTGGADVWEGLAPVGSFPATPWGFHDLAGNAFEWCADVWTWPWEIGGAATDPLQSGSAGFTAWRAIRGGGWNFHWAGCRNGYRGGELAVESHSYIGFRVVRRGYQSVTGGPEVVRVVPSPLLHPASPNPFNPRTTLRFELPTGVHRAELSLFDVRGRRVRTLLDGEAPERGEVVWDGRDDGGSEVASGSYFAVLRTERGESRTKLSLIR